MNLTDLDRMYAEATPGPWESNEWTNTLGERMWSIAYAGDENINLDGFDPTPILCRCGPPLAGDRALIVALHNAYPSLAKRIRELEARCVDLEWAARRATDDGEPITRHLKD